MENKKELAEVKKMRVVAYCRYSSDNQREESIQAQLRAIREYCEKEKHSLVETYVDEAISGKSTNDRVAFNKMIEDSKEGNFDGVLVHKLDRFSRNRYDSAVAKKKLKDNSVRVLSVLENLDDSPESAMMESVLEGMAEYYSLNLAREVKKGLNENALQCLHNGGIPPLGYDVTKEKKYIINEEEAIIIKEIFSLASEGYGYINISAALNERGYKNKLGRNFNKTSIRDTLLNEKYIGNYVYGKKDKKGNNTNKEVRIENGMPGIIEKEVFYLVNSKLNERKTGSRPQAKTPYLLAGLIKCKICGSTYSGGYRTVNRDKSTSYGYNCTGRKTKKTVCDCKSTNKFKLEKKVIEIIKENIFTEKKIELISNEIYEHISKVEKGSELLFQNKNIEIIKIKRKIDSLLELYLDEKLSREIFENKKEELEMKLFSLENEKNKINNNTSFLDKEKIKNYLKKLSKDFESKDSKLIENIIKIFVKQIEIDNDRVYVYLDPVPVDMGLSGGDEPNNTLSINLIKERYLIY